MVAARASAFLRALRLRREHVQNLLHANAPAPPAASPSSLTLPPAPHAPTRGIVVSGAGWLPSAHVHVASAPARALRALAGTRGRVVSIVGDSPMLLRSGGERAGAALRAAAGRLGVGPRGVHCAGMGLTAAITREERDEDRGLPQVVLRMLSSTKGPQSIGIGWLREDVRRVTGAVLFHSAVVGVAYVAWMVPAAWPWVGVCSMIAYATRPDLAGFRRFIRERAPDVARRKTDFIDRVRARLAPVMMGLCEKPVVQDYGLFSVVSVHDYADYVYVYFGVLGRWVLLGWYHSGDDFNFDN